MSTPDPTDDELQEALEVVSDPVRRSILRQLASCPDWSLACSMFDLPVGKATSSHHFAVLRNAGLLEQRGEGTRLLNRLRREDFDRRFPGLLDLVVGVDEGGTGRRGVATERSGAGAVRRRSGRDPRAG